MASPPPSVFFANYGEITNSQIQQSSPGASQALNVARDQHERLCEIVESLGTEARGLGLQSEDQSVVESDLQAAAQQLERPKLNLPVISGLLEAIKASGEESIVEGAKEAVSRLVDEALSLISQHWP